MAQDPQSVSDSTVSAFSSADEATQRSALAKMSPEAKTALLTGLKKRQSATPLPPQEGTAAKLGRGATLGAFEGLGIPEASSAKDVVTGAVKNFGTGIYEAGKTLVNDNSRVQQATGVPLGGAFKIIDNMATSLENSGSEAWKGVKDKDPELFAHGMGSLITQALTLGETGERGPGALDRSAKAGGRLAKAADITKDSVEALDKALPDIVTEAQKRGVRTVGELRDTTQAASRATDAEFNSKLAPIAQNYVAPRAISRNIIDLITLDMAKTAEGRAQIAQIRAAAREYNKPWTVEELNSKRMTENSNLTSFYDKSSQAQNASKLDTDISKAVRDGASEEVYREYDQANPGASARDLKARQGALWKMNDVLTERAKDLRAKQLQFEGEGKWERIKTHATASKSGLHGYFGGIDEAFFSGGPEKDANTKVKSAFRSTPFEAVSGASVLALPVSVLSNPRKAKSAPAPPPQP